MFEVTKNYFTQKFLTKGIVTDKNKDLIKISPNFKREKKYQTKYNGKYQSLTITTSK